MASTVLRSLAMPVLQATDAVWSRDWRGAMQGVLCHGQWLCPDHKYHETSKSQMEPLRSKAELADLQQVFFRDIRWGGLLDTQVLQTGHPSPSTWRLG